MKKLHLCLTILSLACIYSCTKNPSPDTPASPQVPVVTTSAVINVTDSSADTGGSVTDDQGFPVTARGIVYGVDSLPTFVSSLKTTDGSGVGSYLSKLTGLSLNTRYYVRAYAINSQGTGYGNQVIFKTTQEQLEHLPVVTTSAVNNLTEVSANTGGNITDDGGIPVMVRGVVYSTDSLPTVEVSSKTFDGSAAGTFVSTLNNLSKSTKYYVRAYATNSKGTGYGNQVVFTTPSQSQFPEFQFNFYKDQSTEIIIDSGVVISPGYGGTPFRRSAYITNQLALPQGIFFYVEVDSIENTAWGGYEHETTSKTFNNGDTVHIDGHERYIIGAATYSDPMGLSIYSKAHYKIKIGGKAITSGNSYYCTWYPDFALSNTAVYYKYYTDSSYQCNFAH